MVTVRLPERDERPRLVASRGLHAVSAVARGRNRRPIEVVARPGLAVDLQAARADEVAAVAAVNDLRRLQADRARADLARLVAATPCDVLRVRAQAGTRAASAAAS